MANFAGWFLTAFVINGIAIYGFKTLEKIKRDKITDLFGLGLYYGIMGFGLVIAMYLQQWILVGADFLWVCVSVFFLLNRKNKTSFN